VRGIEFIASRAAGSVVPMQNLQVSMMRENREKGVQKEIHKKTNKKAGKCSQNPNSFAKENCKYSNINFVMSVTH
jgi:hypothetical protein